MPVILAPQKAEIRRIMVQSQPRQKKNPSLKRPGGVAWWRVCLIEWHKKKHNIDESCE
jgi:hypothetical protein